MYVAQSPKIIYLSLAGVKTITALGKKVEEMTGKTSYKFITLYFYGVAIIIFKYIAGGVPGEIIAKL